MKKSEKERVVAELTERLRTAQTLFVADYRGLTMPQIDALRSRLLESGARFSVVKNTLTRRAAEAAGVDALLALLEGPTAIAFLEAGGDPAAVAKAIRDAAREAPVLVVRGGVLEGTVVTAEEVESLATLPPFDILRGQVLGAIVAPLTTLLGLVNAPLQNLIGLIDARVEQLEAGGGAAPAPEAEAAAKPEEAPAQEATAAEPEPPADTDTGAETAAAAELSSAEAPAADDTTTDQQTEAKEE